MENNILPNNWKTVKLGEVGTFKTSSVDKLSHNNEIPIKLLNYMDVYKRNYIRQTDIFQNITATEKEIETFDVKKSDVFFTPSSETRDDIGHSAVALDDLNGVLYSYHLIRFRPNKSIFDIGYLGYCFRTEQIYKELQIRAQGITRYTLSIGAFNDIIAIIPPLPEQTRIAGCLSAWDAGIETLKKLITAKKKLKKGLMQRLLSPKNPLAGFESVEWRSVKLGEIGEISSGGTPDTTNSNYWNGDIFWITPTEITKLENRFIYKTERKITKEGLKNSSAKLLPINSVIVCTRATIGEIGINKIELATNQGFKNIIVNKDNNVDYIYFLLKQNKHKLIEKASGSTFLEISKSEFENLEFYLPPLPEQTRIATCLSVWDAGIGKLKKLITAKKKLKKGLMQRLLSPENPLPGFEGAQWRSVRLGDLGKIYQPQTIANKDFTKEGYPVYGANGQIGFYHSYNHETWQVLITCRGSTCGTINKTIDKSWITGNAMVVNVDENQEVSKLFLYYILSNQKFNHCITGSGQPQITQDPLQSFEIHLPPLPTQQRIATILSKADEEIELLQKKLNNFETQKKGLMQVLLSGKVRFSEFIG